MATDMRHHVASHDITYVAGVVQQEAPSAVSVLCIASLEAPLAHQGSLLVS